MPTQDDRYSDAFIEAYDRYNAAKGKLSAARAFRAAVEGAKKEVLALHDEVVRTRGRESPVAETVRRVHLSRVLALSAEAARREHQLESEIQKLEGSLFTFADQLTPRVPRRLQ